jgi:hypothetical protein
LPFLSLHPPKKWVPHPRRVFVFAPRVGWREPQSVSFKLRTNMGAARTSIRLIQTPHEPGCPIQALLGWDSTNFAFGASRRTCICFSSLHPPKKWVPHPRRVFVLRLGWDGANLNLSHSTQLRAPSKLCLGGTARTSILGRVEEPAFAFLPFTHAKNGCPTLGAFLFLRLGWDGANLNPSHSNSARTRVPHPSSAWVG